MVRTAGSARQGSTPGHHHRLTRLAVARVPDTCWMSFGHPSVAPVANNRKAKGGTEATDHPSARLERGEPCNGQR